MNPWTLAALQSRSLLYPALPASFAAQLVALQLLYALAIAFGLAGLGARIYRYSLVASAAQAPSDSPSLADVHSTSTASRVSRVCLASTRN